MMAVAVHTMAAELAAEVYRDDDLTIHAGISDLSTRIVNFGTVLPLVVKVSYDADRVSLENLDGNFFTRAWSPDDGAVLLDWQTSSGPASDRDTTELHAEFRFQLLACPDDKRTCPGTRIYALPDFSLDYSVDAGDPEADAPRTVRFRPWPSTLIVASAIPLDEEDQLYPFQNYFPTGAYPEPLDGTNSSRASLGIAGVGLLVLLGGILMWPFRFRKQSPFAVKAANRWQELWDELQEDNGADEARFFDRLRRCVVWYCTDELGRDPYNWLHASEQVSAEDADDVLDSLRKLFVELLQNPAGQGPELQTRFADLIVHDESH
jgi:hypothetical protein